MLRRDSCIRLAAAAQMLVLVMQPQTWTASGSAVTAAKDISFAHHVTDPVLLPIAYKGCTAERPLVQ